MQMFDYEQANARLLKSIKREMKALLAKPLWGNDKLLSAAKGQLEGALSQLQMNLLDISGVGQAESEEAWVDPEIIAEGEEALFVYLYNMDGENMNKWMDIVQSLIQKVVTRPVYPTRESVEKLIRSKPNKFNEGYVMIHTKPELIDTDEQEHDRLDQPLTRVRDRSILLENICTFYHITGKYIIKNNTLVKYDDYEIAGVSI